MRTIRLPILLFLLFLATETGFANEKKIAVINGDNTKIVLLKNRAQGLYAIRFKDRKSKSVHRYTVNPEKARELRQALEKAKRLTKKMLPGQKPENILVKLPEGIIRFSVDNWATVICSEGGHTPHPNPPSVFCFFSPEVREHKKKLREVRNFFNKLKTIR